MTVTCMAMRCKMHSHMAQHNMGMRLDGQAQPKLNQCARIQVESSEEQGVRRDRNFQACHSAVHHNLKIAASLARARNKKHWLIQ